MACCIGGAVSPVLVDPMTAFGGGGEVVRAAVVSVGVAGGAGTGPAPGRPPILVILPFFTTSCPKGTAARSPVQPPNPRVAGGFVVTSLSAD